MPETKLTIRAFLEHLRKYGAVYLIGIAACLFGTELLWTVTSPAVPAEQSVIIYLAGSYSNPEALEGIAEEMLTRGKKFDPKLKTVEFQSIPYYEPDMDYSGPMVLMAKLSVGEGDAFLASKTVMDQLVAGGALLPLDGPVEEGWMNDCPLEPYYADYTDEETGEKFTFLAGLKIDTLEALSEMGAFYNEGSTLAVAANGTNRDTTLYCLEILVHSLQSLNAAP